MFCYLLLLNFLGSITSTPISLHGYICPEGHYCLAGDTNERKCKPGTYAPSSGLGQCLPCRAGYMCPNEATVNPIPCPAGQYCENGTKFNTGKRCPIGYYNPYQNQTSLSNCLPCPAGKFCEKEGLEQPSGDCLEGFLCSFGAKTPADLNNLCPVGMYCVNGTQNATLCPDGTMRKHKGGKNVDDCAPCAPGHFCSGLGLFEPSGVCKQGYYCPDYAKINVSKPSLYICPAGHYCGEEASLPHGCAPSQYQTSYGSSVCIDCPEGKFCPGNTSFPQPCPAYHYCSIATVTPTPCPNGTYTEANVVGLSRPDLCTPCPLAVYCQNGRIAGKCNGGYLCYGGSPIPNPTSGKHGIVCPFGYYCPPGANQTHQCPKGKVIAINGSDSEKDCKGCPAGFICTINHNVPQPCERGYYCPFNKTRLPCRKGTYNNKTKATDEKFCITCPAGYWCAEAGT